MKQLALSKIKCDRENLNAFEKRRPLPPSAIFCVINSDLVSLLPKCILFNFSTTIPFGGSNAIFTAFAIPRKRQPVGADTAWTILH